jgi:hypothetical protein
MSKKRRAYIAGGPVMDLIKQLNLLVQSSIDAESDADDLMNKAAEEGNYTKAAEMKVQKELHHMFALRLQRVIEGKSAFGEGQKTSNHS